MTAPIGRVMSARPTVSAMSGRDFPKAVATSWMTNVRTKKSKASSVHPRNPASTALRWFARSCPDIVDGMRWEGYMLFPVNPAIREWVDEVRALTNPDSVVYCDGSEMEQARLIAEC